MKCCIKASLETVLKLIVSISILSVAIALISIQLKISMSNEMRIAAENAKIALEIAKDLDINNAIRLIRNLSPLLVPSPDGNFILRSKYGHIARFKINKQEIILKSIESNKILLVWGIIALLISIEIAVFLAYIITNPIKRLSWAMRKLSKNYSNSIISINGSFIWELEDLIMTFNTMSQQINHWRSLQSKISLMNRLASMGEMVSGVAHEIRNPIAAIKIHLDLLIETKEQLTKEALEHISFIEDELTRLADTVDRFLLFAKPHKGNIDAIPIGNIISWACQMVDSMSFKNNIQIKLDIEDQNQLVEADPGKLRQILLNLTSNGIEAMPGGGNLTIWTKLDGDMLNIGVDDTGEGIPDDISERIFEPFVTTKPNGTGLGLAIAKKLTEEMGGSLGFLSKNGGTSFVLKLRAFNYNHNPSLQYKGVNNNQGG